MPLNREVSELYSHQVDHLIDTICMNIDMTIKSPDVHPDHLYYKELCEILDKEVPSKNKDHTEQNDRNSELVDDSDREKKREEIIKQYIKDHFPLAFGEKPLRSNPEVIDQINKRAAISMHARRIVLDGMLPHFLKQGNSTLNRLTEARIDGSGGVYKDVRKQVAKDLIKRWHRDVAQRSGEDFFRQKDVIKQKSKSDVDLELSKDMETAFSRVSGAWHKPKRKITSRLADAIKDTVTRIRKTFSKKPKISVPVGKFGIDSSGDSHDLGKLRDMRSTNKKHPYHRTSCIILAAVQFMEGKDTWDDRDMAKHGPLNQHQREAHQVSAILGKIDEYQKHLSEQISKEPSHIYVIKEEMDAMQKAMHALGRYTRDEKGFAEVVKKHKEVADVIDKKIENMTHSQKEGAKKAQQKHGVEQQHTRAF